MGKEASRFTDSLLEGEAVYLVRDPGVPDRDRYGRLLEADAQALMEDMPEAQRG